MKASRFHVDDLRAVLRSRAIGTPRPDLPDRIREATRLTQRPAVVLVPTRRRGTIIARLAAVAGLAAALIVAGSGWQGPDRLVGRPAPEKGISGAVEAAIDDDDLDDDEGDDDEDEDDEDTDDEDDEDEEAEESRERDLGR